MKNKYFSVLFLILIVLARIISSGQSLKVMKNLPNSGDDPESKQIIIVIDPGHGGRDPGKVGVNDALEKDINLKISMKLKDLLEEKDIKIIMTREEDIGLYSETDSNKKRADLKNRIEIINSSDAVFAISIHQNSFSEEYVKGAQVFFHGQSDKGRELALVLQEQLKETIKDGNHRKAKSNESYYMLTRTQCPLVIVECGYLSNHTEAALLNTEDYQEKLALAISLGVLKYLKNTNT
ncbi:MAG TPA: N-acetylmuramoyl-L-alanine amidase [Mobilitalea sp.]|nr:N-acetylmuramoyl-L-alanine amidase [Mobilitalea sp.]